MNTTMLREQHDKLLDLAGKIAAELSENELSKDAFHVRHQLSNLYGILSNHLWTEDTVLYPQLLEYPDEEVQLMVRQFIDEMGGIGAAVNEYQSQWTTAMEIQKDPATFIAQTESLFSTLSNRIYRENKEIYPILAELELELYHDRYPPPRES